MIITIKWLKWNTKRLYETRTKKGNNKKTRHPHLEPNKTTNDPTDHGPQSWRLNPPSFVNPWTLELMYLSLI